MADNHSPSVENSNYFQRLKSSFDVPAYRWIWLNSVFGSMRLINTFVVRGWLVLTLTNSPFWVGAAPAMRGLTQILLGLFAGVLLDRIDRKKAFLITEIGTTVVSIIIAILVFTNQIALWHIFVASFFEGAFMAVRWPVINTMIIQTVGPKRVLNASASQMLGFNLGNVIASAAAGIIVDRFGIGTGYLFGASMGVVASVCILFVSGDYKPVAHHKVVSIKKSITEGLAYIKTHDSLIYFISLALLMSFLGWSNFTMLPVMARDVLFVEASGLGFLTSAGAVGSLISTAVIAGLGDFKDKTRLIIWAGVGTTIGILGFSLSSNFYLSLLLMFFMQGALMAFEVTITATVLLVTDDKMQGRVQGIYTQVFGFTWVGGIFLGAIAELTGAPIAIAIGGVGIGFTILLLKGRLGEDEKISATRFENP